LAADQRVGIDGGDDAAGDFGGDERVGAGAGAAVMAAGLEGDVGGGAFYGVAVRGGLLEGDDLGVVSGVVKVGAFADDFSFVYEDAAHLGIGTGEADGLAGELYGALHEVLVAFVGHRECFSPLPLKSPKVFETGSLSPNQVQTSARRSRKVPFPLVKDPKVFETGYLGSRMWNLSRSAHVAPARSSSLYLLYRVGGTLYATAILFDLLGMGGLGA
jgi:hypothetical protein